MMTDHTTAVKDDLSHSDLTSETPATAPEPPEPIAELRPPVIPFVGRDGVVARVVQHIRSTAHGGATALMMGCDGLGKTELAFAVAHQLQQDFPDAQLFLNLRRAGDRPLSPARALQSLVHTFNPQASVLDDLAQLRERYHTLLAGKRVLILADDASDAEQVGWLLPPAGCALLVTSRATIDIDLDGAATEPLEPLPNDDAAHLLRTLCPHTEPIAPRLAEACGGLPLALQLCANLLANNDTHDGEHALNELLATIATLHEREQADPAATEQENRNTHLDGCPLPVIAAIQTSYHALAPLPQALLRQLGVFQASFDLDTARAVVNLQQVQPDREQPPSASSNQPRPKGRAAPPALENLLDTLCHLGLVEHDPDEQSYLLHRCVRAFAAAQMNEQDRKVYWRYVKHYAEMAADIEALYLQGSEKVLEALEMFDQERTHIEAGWLWAQRQQDHNLLLSFTCVIGYTGQQRYHMQHDYVPQAEEALAAAQRLRRKGDECHALNVLGSAYRSLGNLSQALDYYQRALVLVRSVKKLGNEGAILRNMGNALLSQGNVESAIQHYKRSLKVAQKTGDMREQCDSLGKLGLAHTERGENQKAQDYYQQCLGIAREFHYRDYEGEALGGMGLVCVALGQPEDAVRLCEQALTIARNMHNRRDEAYALHFLGSAGAADGRLSQAQDHQEQARVLAADIGERRLEGRILNSLGEIALAQGNQEQARSYLEQAYSIAQAVADHPGEVRCAWNLGVALSHQPDPSSQERAKNFLAIRVAYEQAIGHPDAATHAERAERMATSLTG